MLGVISDMKTPFHRAAAPFFVPFFTFIYFFALQSWEGNNSKVETRRLVLSKLCIQPCG